MTRLLLIAPTDFSSIPSVAGGYWYKCFPSKTRPLLLIPLKIVKHLELISNRCSNGCLFSLQSMPRFPPNICNPNLLAIILHERNLVLKLKSITWHSLMTILQVNRWYVLIKKLASSSFSEIFVCFYCHGFLLLAQRCHHRDFCRNEAMRYVCHRIYWAFWMVKLVTEFYCKFNSLNLKRGTLMTVIIHSLMKCSIAEQRWDAFSCDIA